MALLPRTGGFKKRTGVLCGVKYSFNIYVKEIGIMIEFLTRLIFL
jgi:hypothetical protein